VRRPYQFTAYTIYDPLVAWEWDRVDRRQTVPASPPMKSMTRTKPSGDLAVRKGVNSTTAATSMPSGDLELDKS